MPHSWNCANDGQPVMYRQDAIIAREGCQLGDRRGICVLDETVPTQAAVVDDDSWQFGVLGYIPVHTTMFSLPATSSDSGNIYHTPHITNARSSRSSECFLIIVLDSNSCRNDVTCVRSQKFTKCKTTATY